MVVATPAWVSHPWVEAGRGQLRFAIHGGPYADWSQFVDLIQRAEVLGFDAYWMSDHPSRNPGCWTTLAALASATKSIRLGTLVNCVLYRSAFEVARHAVDVDRISNGRVILGLGAGDFEDECRQMGIAMPSARERVRLLEAMIQSVKALCGETNGGQTVSRGPTLSLGPVQSPRIPLLVAGLGQVTLRYVAEYADAVNIPPAVSGVDALAGRTVQALTPVDVEQKLAILEAHCSDLSRPLSSVVRSHMAPVVLGETEAEVAEKLNGLPERARQVVPFAIIGTPGQAMQAYASLAVRGIDYFIALILGNDLKTLDLLAKLRPALEEQLTTVV